MKPLVWEGTPSPLTSHRPEHRPGLSFLPLRRRALCASSANLPHMEARRPLSPASVAAAAALAVLLMAAAAAGYSTITIYSGPGCSGKSATYECGYHQIPVHGGFRFHCGEGFPVLILRFPGRGDGRRALLSPVTTRYARDAESCDIPDRHYAQMSC